MARVVAMAIKLLGRFLDKNVERCGEVEEVLKNVKEFATNIMKDCYPKGLERQSHVESIAIHRRLEGEEDQVQFPRELKSYFIYKRIYDLPGEELGSKTIRTNVIKTGTVVFWNLWVSHNVKGAGQILRMLEPDP